MTEILLIVGIFCGGMVTGFVLGLAVADRLIHATDFKETSDDE